MRLSNKMPLISPNRLAQEFPASLALKNIIENARVTTRNIINKQDQRLLVIAGPCSIHDIHSGYAFAELLQQAISEFKNDLFIIMRVYFEKPRTTLGWRGLISDPYLDGSLNINHGLKLARQFLIALAELGVPAATEFLDPIIPQYLSDLISWNAVGARTAESQLHREIASGLPTPVGFKNSTNGNIQVAIDAANTARHPHQLLSIDENGSSTILHTKGNDCCHIILRGANDKTNYSAFDITNSIQMLKNSQLLPHVMIDCSHGNSMKNYQNQIQVAQTVCEQIEMGSEDIFGVMLESNLIAGNQRLEKNKKLIYGQSITDECISWDDTMELFSRLAKANQLRKNNKLQNRSY